jgi:hypothetical protein
VRAQTFRVLPEVAESVVARVREEAGVTEASASPVTGSVLVLYDPAETQILRILRTIVLTGGLAGIEVDRVEPEPRPPPGGRLRDALGKLDARVREVSGGELDLRVAIPGTLALLGVRKLLSGPPRIPEWYDLLFWSFVTFSNLNPREGATAAAAPSEPQHG